MPGPKKKESTPRRRRKEISPSKDMTPEERYKSKGFTDPRKPEFDLPYMVENISTLNPGDLGNLSSKYRVWGEYTEELIMEAIVTVNSLNDEYDQAFLKAKLISEERSKDLREADASTQPEIKKINSKLQEEETYLLLLEKRLSSIEKSIAIISREITRRSNN